jgi:hypothetical protein
MQLDCKTLDEGCKQIAQFKRWQPFKYSGKWFLAEFNGEFFAYRTKQPLKNKAIKLGLESFNLVELE